MNKKRLLCLGISMILVFSFTGCGIFDSLKTSVTDELGTLVVGEAENVETISAEKYAYSCLNEEEKSVYDQVLDGILKHTDTITVSTKDDKVLEKAFNCVMSDYGGLFWVSGYQYNTYTSGSTVIGLEFMPKYIMTEEERESTQTQIDAVVTEWLSGISTTDSDYEKAKYVFETLIQKVDYDENSENNQNIISVFLNQKTVCQGYADAAVYLLDQLGIRSTIITGTANGEAHAWNLVNLDEQYYFMDVTWGNSRYLDNSSEEQKTINYGYLNMTSEEISSTHISESDFDVPECSATDDNYFCHEGLYFSTWDPNAIGSVLRGAWENDDDTVSIKLSDSELYQKAFQYFIKDQHITEYCSGLTQVSYIQDEVTCVLVIKLHK